MELRIRRVGSLAGAGAALLGERTGSEGAGSQLRITTEQGADLLLPAVVEFADGQSERRLLLAAVQDTVAEPDASFTLQVTGDDAAPRSPRSQVTIRVRDDDRDAVLTTQFLPESHADPLGGPTLALPNGDLLMMVYPSGFNSTLLGFFSTRSPSLV